MPELLGVTHVLKRDHRILRQLLLLSILFSVYVISCSSYESGDISFVLEIRDRQIDNLSSPLQIRKNDRVTIFVTADEHVTFHLHGYDITKVIAPDVTTTIELVATATGSFPFTMHTSMGSHDHGHGESSHECKASLPPNAPLPVLSLDTELVSGHEVRVIVRVTDFLMAGSPNENRGIAFGHWHLLVDDVLVGMYTTPEVVIPIAEKSHHTLTVTLTDDNHCSFDISATTMIELPKAEHKEHGEHATDESDIELGRLEVRP